MEISWLTEIIRRKEFFPWNSCSLDLWAKLHAQGKIIDLNGRSTHYIEKGSGDPLILIHGFNMDLNTWLFNIDALAEHFHVYAYDIWGLGFSTREQLDFGYDLFCEQLLYFMDAMGINKAALVGHSMGGGTVINFSLQHRERVEKLILVDATGIPNPLPLRSKVFTLPGVGEFLLSINNNYLRRKNLREIWLYNQETLTDDIFDKVTQFQKVRGTSEILLEILRKDFFHTLESEISQLGTMDIPILVVWGQQDASIPVQIGEQMHKKIAGSQLEIIEGGGHMPNFDCPEVFNRIVIEFMWSN